MRGVSTIRVFSAVFIFLAAVSMFLFSRYQAKSAEAGNVEFALKAPSFMKRGSAQDALDPIASVLDNEAGISAYFKAPVAVNLDDVRDLYHTIEIETADYILGSISVPDNREEYDVHVYIDESGWMLAYYLYDKPAVRIFDWETWIGTMNPTRFQSVLNYVATALNIATPALTYYDFRYPDATNLLLVVEDGLASTINTFDILSTNFTYFERSCGAGGTHIKCNFCSYFSTVLVDGKEVHRTNAVANVPTFDTGMIEATDLPPSEPHTITIAMSANWNSTVIGALAIVYGP